MTLGEPLRLQVGAMTGGVHRTLAVHELFVEVIEPTALHRCLPLQSVEASVTFANAEVKGVGLLVKQDRRVLDDLPAGALDARGYAASLTLELQL